MSFFTQTVAIPVWLLLLIIGGMIPLLVRLYKNVVQYRRDAIAREEHAQEERDNLVRWKLSTLSKSISPGTAAVDAAKEKSKEKKADILHVLTIMAEEGDKGMLLKAVADRLDIKTSKVQQAMQRLVDKKLVEEVVGVSGTKYYLTEVGKKYCLKKGFIKVE